jgi:tetratricopeptide (TPR) repeat protein
VARGDADFKAGNYDAAIRDWNHAMVDDPQNPGLMLLIGQALFATKQYDQSAGITQAALSMLPTDKWGTVVANYRDLYPNNQAYTDQLRALEATRKTNDSPAVRFLLGYHYGFLGYPKEAMAELDKAISLAPQDNISQQLRDVMVAKQNPGAAPAIAPATPNGATTAPSLPREF